MKKKRKKHYIRKERTNPILKMKSKMSATEFRMINDVAAARIIANAILVAVEAIRTRSSLMEEIEKNKG